jgi:glucan phosphoethanolaminetransferase (alkaline phosphatase superfamily)
VRFLVECFRVRTRASRRGRLRRRRRALALVTLLLPGLAMVVSDLVRRAGHLARLPMLDKLLYVRTIGGSLALWAILLYVAAGRRGPFRGLGAFVFIALFGFAWGVQHAFFSTYGVYVSLDPLIFGDDILLGIIASLPLSRPPLVGFLSLGLLAATGMLLLARRWVRPARTPRRIAPAFATVAVVLAFAVPLRTTATAQAAMPELLYFHGEAVFQNDLLSRKLGRMRPQIVRVQVRTPTPVPPLDARPPTKRNVVLLLQEAQRADATCTAYEPSCAAATRASNRLLPGRLPFLQARAAASSTAVAVAVLWSGIDPTETYDVMYSAPLVWDYAVAAGYDTAYWTSQNLMFGNARLFVQDIPVSAFATGTEIDPECDMLTGADDQKLVDRVIRDWPKLKEPFFAVVHFSNIHRPRVIEPGDLPFQPTNTSDKGTGGQKGKNYYLNSVYRSDLAVARLIQHIRATPAGARTVLVYTSDHGEAYGEHKNENDHSATVYDEEIRVPFYIDAPPGVLSDEEIAGYRANRLALVSQYDQAATLFDLLGFWDDPAFRPFRKRMLGTPVARPLALRSFPLTNVSWVWEYHRPNWGMMRGSLKVLAQIEDPAYLCFDVLRDPGERRNLGPDACAELVKDADRTFGMLPKDMKRLRQRPDFGRARATGGRSSP